MDRTSEIHGKADHRDPAGERGEGEGGCPLDFVHDQFAGGRRFRMLNLVDDGTREGLTAIPDTSISGRRVARELSALAARRGRPRNDRQRQRHGVHIHLPVWRGPTITACPWHRVPLTLHRARKADPEQLRGKLQRPDARRAVEREPVLQPRSRSPETGRLDDDDDTPAAPRSATKHPRLRNAPLRNMPTRCKCGSSTGSACCSPRAGRRNHRRHSGPCWMKDQRQAISPAPLRR